MFIYLGTYKKKNRSHSSNQETNHIINEQTSINRKQEINTDLLTPNKENIKNSLSKVIEFTECSEELAKKALLEYSGNVNNAINAILTGLILSFYFIFR